MNRKNPPEIKDAIDFNLVLKPYTYFELDNGVPVYAVDAGAQEVIQLEFVFYAGNNFEQRKGIAAAVNYLLKNGTKSRSAFQINEDFEYYGAYCNRSCYNETSIVTLHTLTRHLDKLLPVLQDMFTESVFLEEELDIYKQNSQQRLTVNLQKGDYVAGRKINEFLYGNEHPYGRNMELTDFEGITRDELMLFYQQYYLSGKCAIFAAGILPADLKEKLNNLFGKLNLSKPSYAFPDIKAQPVTEKKHRIENDPTSVQGAIRIAANFPNRHHPDFKKAVVLNTLYGGFFGSRLMSNIREDKGYTYGIHSYFQNHIMQSAWVISTEAGRDVCEAAVLEIYKEMEELRETNIDKEELLLVKNYMLGSILGDLDGPFHIISKWKSIILNNLDENYFYESVEAIKLSSPKELKDLANKYLQPEKFIELIVY